MSYEDLIDRFMGNYAGVVCEMDLFRFYYAHVFNEDAVNCRRSERLGGEKRRDVDLVVPRVRRVENFLKSGSVEEFFEQGEDLRDGLSREGFENYLVYLDGARRDYVDYVKKGGLDLL